MRALVLILLVLCAPMVCAQESIIDEIRSFLHELFLRSSQQNQVTGFVVHEPEINKLQEAEQVPYDPPGYELRPEPLVPLLDVSVPVSSNSKDQLISKLQSAIDAFSQPLVVDAIPITYSLHIEGHRVPNSKIHFFVEPTAQDVRYTLRKDDVSAQLTTSSYRLPAEGDYTLSATFQGEDGLVTLSESFSVGTLSAQVAHIDLSSSQGTHLLRGPAQVTLTSGELYSLDMGLYFLAGKKVRVPLGSAQGVVHLPEGLFEVELDGNN